MWDNRRLVAYDIYIYIPPDCRWQVMQRLPKPTHRENVVSPLEESTKQKAREIVWDFAKSQWNRASVDTLFPSLLPLHSGNHTLSTINEIQNLPSNSSTPSCLLHPQTNRSIFNFRHVIDKACKSPCGTIWCPPIIPKQNWPSCITFVSGKDGVIIVDDDVPGLEDEAAGTEERKSYSPATQWTLALPPPTNSFNLWYSSYSV